MSIMLFLCLIIISQHHGKYGCLTNYLVKNIMVISFLEIKIKEISNFKKFYECCKTGTDLAYVFQTQYLSLLFKQDTCCVD